LDDVLVYKRDAVAAVIERVVSIMDEEAVPLAIVGLKRERERDIPPGVMVEGQGSV
jgi:hypothetical protein